MPFALFHDLCPDVAERETRTITVTPAANFGLPPGNYAFAEGAAKLPKGPRRKAWKRK